MSEYGLELRDASEQVVFNLTNRMTNLIWSKTVGANSSGNTYVHIPKHFHAVVHAVALSSDAYVRHIPHRVSFNPNNGYITWSPALTNVDEDNVKNFKAVGKPIRSASRIHVIGYVKQ